MNKPMPRSVSIRIVRKFPLFTLIAFLVVTLVADLASKFFMLAWLPQHPNAWVDVIPGWFAFFLQYNTGGAFSLGYDYPWVIGSFAILAVGVIYFWGRKTFRGNHFGHSAIGMIIGGALGNIHDRIRFHAVVDFIHVHRGEWYWPTFNIADSMILIGIGIMVLETFRMEQAQKRAAAASASDAMPIPEVTPKPVDDRRD